MHRILSALALILAATLFAALPFCHAASGDYIGQFAGASGATVQLLTPSANDVITFNGAGGLTTVARANWLTPSGSGSALTGLTKSQVGLGSVENTALSTWTGSTAITTLGTVTTGTFSGTLGAISGAALTGLNASNLASGTVPTARLGTGTASSSTFLRGDGAWAATGGSGTVTSVAATVPSFLSVSGSPITSSGTLAITLSGTALPVANGGTGLTALGTGVATWLGTPTLANFNAATTDNDAASLAANTFTGVQTITPSANAKALVASNATHTADAPMLDLAQTWNNGAVTFTAAKIAITSTASAATSKLLDVTLGGTSVLIVRKDGAVLAPLAGYTFGMFMGSGVLANQYGLFTSSSNGRSYLVANGNTGLYTANNGTTGTEGSAFALGAGCDFQISKTITPAGTTGAQTINKNLFSVNFAAGATTLVVTNSLITTSSVIIHSIASNDATAAGLSHVTSAGSVTLKLAVAGTNEVKVVVLVVN